MTKHEQQWTTKFLKWLKWKDIDIRGEVKVITSGNYCYNSDKSFPKEMRNLLMKRSIEKFSDAGGHGTIYDLVSTSAPAYFILHWKRRGNKRFYMIPAKVLNDFILETKPVSITEEDCRNLGGICDLK